MIILDMEERGLRILPQTTSPGGIHTHRIHTPQALMDTRRATAPFHQGCMAGILDHHLSTLLTPFNISLIHSHLDQLHIHRTLLAFRERNIQLIHSDQSLLSIHLIPFLHLLLSLDTALNHILPSK